MAPWFQRGKRLADKGMEDQLDKTMELAIHRQIGPNDRGTDFVVGDVHGEFARLQRKLRAVAFDPSRDRLFALGDLVDRGPDSEGVLELLACDWFHSVIGNHESMLLEGLRSRESRLLHLMNGGGWFQDLPPRSQDALAASIREHCSLALTLETDQGPLGLIHATAPEDWRSVAEGRLDASDWERLLWDRQDFYLARLRPGAIGPVKGVHLTVHGHVSCARAGRAANRCWIDTLYRGGGLTLLPCSELAALPSP